MLIISSHRFNSGRYPLFRVSFRSRSTSPVQNTVVIQARQQSGRQIQKYQTLYSRLHLNKLDVNSFDFIISNNSIYFKEVHAIGITDRITLSNKAQFDTDRLQAQGHLNSSGSPPYSTWCRPGYWRATMISYRILITTRRMFSLISGSNICVQCKNRMITKLDELTCDLDDVSDPE